MEGIYCGWDLGTICRLDPPQPGGYRWKLTLHGRRQPLHLEPHHAVELQAIMAANQGLQAISGEFEKLLG
jgi:hypothetical protein